MTRYYYCRGSVRSYRFWPFAYRRRLELRDEMGNPIGGIEVPLNSILARVLGFGPSDGEGEVTMMVTGDK